MKREEAQLAVGNKAPAFRALAVGGEFGDGRDVTLDHLRGKPVVLYFYPKDDTPGCTAQACGLRDSWASLQGKAQIFGVSVDSPKSHRKFIDKYELPFPLLADLEKEIVNAYGVWVEKSMYGRKYMGAERSTFIVDADGRIAAIFRKVKPEEHVDLVRDALKKLADK
jgi:thioredoxin-dependent peroxiredoxin